MHPLGASADPAQAVVIGPGGEVAGGAAEQLDALSEPVEKPSRADGRMTGERELGSRREDADPTIGRIVHEDRLAEAEVGRDRLPASLRDLHPAHEDAERIAMLSVGRGEDAKAVQLAWHRSSGW